MVRYSVYLLSHVLQGQFDIGLASDSMGQARTGQYRTSGK